MLQLHNHIQAHITTRLHTTQVLPRDVGAVYVEHCMIKDKYDEVFHYLVVANQFKDGVPTQPEISVYRWENDIKRFIHDHVIRYMHVLYAYMFVCMCAGVHNFACKCA
jgi:hypothetical protein